MQLLGHTRPQQFVMGDFEQIVHDEPDGFRAGHPMQMIEAGEVYRPRKCTQSALPTQVEIKIEIAKGKFAQGPMHGLAITAAREVGFRHGSPVTVHTVEGEDVVGIMLGFEVQEQRWKSDGSQSSRRENR